MTLEEIIAKQRKIIADIHGACVPAHYLCDGTPVYPIPQSVVDNLWIEFNELGKQGIVANLVRLTGCAPATSSSRRKRSPRLS